MRITVDAGDGAKAYAMYAKGTGAVNRLEGSGNSTGTDVFRIEGDIKAENGGKNVISTGLGTNIIDLDGNINAGGLTIEQHGGYDVLVLHAASLSDLESRYHSWLQDLSGLTIHKIDLVLGDDILGNLTNMSDSALDWLTTMFPGLVDVISHQDYENTYGHYTDPFAAATQVDHASTEQAPASFSTRMAPGHTEDNLNDTTGHDHSASQTGISTSAGINTLEADTIHMPTNSSSLTHDNVNWNDEHSISLTSIENNDTIHLNAHDLLDFGDNLEGTVAGLTGEMADILNGNSALSFTDTEVSTIQLDQSITNTGSTVNNGVDTFQVYTYLDAQDDTQYLLIQNTITTLS